MTNLTNTKELAKLVKRDIALHFHQEIGDFQEELKTVQGSKRFTMSLPKNFGVFSLVIEDAHLYLRTQQSQFRGVDTVDVSVSASYTHSNMATNGYTICTLIYRADGDDDSVLAVINSSNNMVYNALDAKTA